MKKLLGFILVLISVFTLKAADEDPYLVKTKDFTVNHFSLSQIDLGIVAVIYNPYKAKIKIDEILIDVFIEDKKLGTITEAADIIKINKQAAFDLPLNISVKTGPTLQKFATEGAKLLIGRKIRVDYKGYVKVKALGFIPIKVKIDQFAYFTLQDIIGTTKTEPKKIEPKDPTLTKP